MTAAKPKIEEEVPTTLAPDRDEAERGITDRQPATAEDLGENQVAIDQASGSEIAEGKSGKGLVEVKIDRPMYTNGVAYGFETKKIDGRTVQVFTGIAHVPKEVAEDLEDRNERYRVYEKGLHENLGRDDQELEL